MKTKYAFIALVLTALASGFIAGQSTNIVVTETTQTPPATVTHYGTIPAGSPVIAQLGNTIIPALDPNHANAAVGSKIPVSLTLSYNPPSEGGNGTIQWTIVYQ